MIYLLFSIIASTLIFVIFRLAKNYSCNLTGLITINYFTASLLGFFLFTPFKNEFINHTLPWFPFAIIVGILFIVMFYLIGISSQKAGITVTTLAHKLSLVFPVMFSLFYFNEKISGFKLIGLITAVIAVLLTIYKKDIKKTNLFFITLPLIIFLGSGITDSVVKYVQAIKTNPEEVAAFSTFVFLIAFFIALLITIFKRKNENKIFTTPTLLLGIFLGATNFGSLYYLMNALNKSNLESSLVFAVNNMSIVALSAIIGKLLFHEKLNKLNIVGIIAAIISLYFLV